MGAQLAAGSKLAGGAATFRWASRKVELNWNASTKGVVARRNKKQAIIFPIFFVVLFVLCVFVVLEEFEKNRSHDRKEEERMSESEDVRDRSNRPTLELRDVDGSAFEYAAHSGFGEVSRFCVVLFC